MTDRLDAVFKSKITKNLIVLAFIGIMSMAGVMLFQQFVDTTWITITFAVLWGFFCGLIAPRPVERLMGLRK